MFHVGHTPSPLCAISSSMFHPAPSTDDDPQPHVNLSFPLSLLSGASRNAAPNISTTIADALSSDHSRCVPTTDTASGSGVKGWNKVPHSFLCRVFGERRMRHVHVKYIPWPICAIPLPSCNPTLYTVSPQYKNIALVENRLRC